MSMNSDHDLEQGIREFYNSDYEAAIKNLEKAYNQNLDPEAGYHLGLCYTQIQEFEKALATFDNVLKRIESNLRIMQIHIIMGYIYTKKEMYDLAEMELLEAENIGIENIQIYSSLGHVYYKKGNINKALSYLKKAIDMDSNNANAHNSYGFILAETDTNMEEAIKEIKYALDLDENNPAYLDSLGWAYFKKKDFFNAKRYLTKAFELAPYSEDIKKHMRTLEKISTADKQK